MTAPDQSHARSPLGQPGTAGGRGPASLVLAREVRSVEMARRWIGEVLQDRSMAEGAAADAALVISELVTNAIRHGSGEIVVRAGVSDRDELHVEVGDSSPALPSPTTVAGPPGEGGFGLRIVGRVATRWGVQQFPGGKTVWASIDLSGRR